MKTTEEMIEVMQAHLRGEKIERWIFNAGDWEPTAHPNWNWAGGDYRIAPKPAPTQDTIPWDAIDERFKWAARDADGRIAMYTDEPYRNGADCWFRKSGEFSWLTAFVGVIPGTVDWRESLQERPAAEEKRP